MGIKFYNTQISIQMITELSKQNNMLHEILKLNRDLMKGKYNIVDKHSTKLKEIKRNVHLDLTEVGKKPIVVDKPTRFMIYVKENPSTGFRWNISKSFEKCGVKLIRDEFFMGTSNMPGAPGKHFYLFKPTSQMVQEFAMLSSCTR